MYVVSGFLLALTLYILREARLCLDAAPTGYLAWTRTRRARWTMRWVRRSTPVLRFHLVVGKGAVIATLVLAAYPSRVPRISPYDCGRHRRSTVEASPSVSRSSAMLRGRPVLEANNG